MASRPKSVRTRRKLLESTARLLNDGGYSAMRVSDICADAGVAHGTFYTYFDNRRDIAIAALEDFVERGFGSIFGAARPADPFAAIFDGTLRYVRWYRSNLGLMRTLMQLSDEYPEVADLWRRNNREFGFRLVADLRRRARVEKLSETQLYIVVNALGSMVDEFLYQAYVVRIPELAGVARSPRILAEHLAVLWFRAMYGCNPEVEGLGKAAALLNLAPRDARRDG